MIHENYSSIESRALLPSMASLQAFEAAARHLSYAEAAQELGRTPSAISHAIKDLESRLRTSLFERAGRRVKLTQSGEDYFASVQSTLLALQTATRRIQNQSDDHIVRISALPFFTSAVLLPNLSRFERDNPRLELRIETSNAYADILNGEADIGIRFGSEHSDDLYRKPLMEVWGQPVAAPSYLATAPRAENAQDLNDHTLLHVRPDLSAWQSWGQSNGVEDLRGGQALTFDSILGAIDAVKAGSGIALAMAPLIETYPGYGTAFVPVLPPGQKQAATYHFVCRKTAAEDLKIRRTLAWLEQSIGQQI